MLRSTSPTLKPMHAPARLLACVLSLALALAAGCGTRHDMTAPILAPPDGATPYATDDATTDRVALAFADLHAALRTLGEGRWQPAYFRVPAGSAWETLRASLDGQAGQAGWHADARLSAEGPGYRRQAWTDGREVVAAALVEPPAGSDGATVLMLLSPRR